MPKPSILHVLVFLLLSTFAQAQEPSYSRQVRPIISDMCFSCHGPDEKGRKGELLLSDYDSALKGGESGLPAIVPGDPSSSELIKRLRSDDPDVCMPPPHTKKKLTEEQIGVLESWVASGAKYEQHWAFKLPVIPEIPETGSDHPIDAFVQASLKGKGLESSQRADKATILRRVTLDLIGLPPTPKELQEFLEDNSPQAYEKVVDRLLDSPNYGERWARKWLDLARYADTNGYEKDRVRSIWPYRDWVIKALNADMPFDQFTIEQIAGDLLPNATLSQRIATGFHRNTMLNEEGGIDPLEFRFHAIVDRVATTGATWLGLTLQCSQCHTHKYDPITHREYYSLMAFLNNADELDLEIPTRQGEGEPPSKDASGNESQLNEAQKRKQQADALLESLPSKWPIEESSIAWTTPEPSLAADSSEPARVLDDRSLLFASPGPASSVMKLRFPKLQGRFTHIRIESLTDESLPGTGPGRTPHGNFVLSEVDVSNSGQRLKLSGATADAEQSGYAAGAAIDGNPQTGWAVHVLGKDIHSSKTLTLSLESELQASGDVQIVLHQVHGSHHTMGRVKVSFGLTELDAAEMDRRRNESLEKAFTQWLNDQSSKAVDWQVVRPIRASSNLPLLSIESDSSVFVSGDITKSDTYELDLGQPIPGITAIRLEALPDARLPGRGPGMAYYEGPKGDFLLGEFRLQADGQAIRIAQATQSYAKNHFGSQAEASYAIDGNPETGWSCAQGQGRAHEAVFRFEKPLTASNLQLTMMFGRHYACSLGRFRISVTTDPGEVSASPLSSEIQQLLRKKDLSEADLKKLRTEFLFQSPQLASTRAQIEQLRRKESYLTTLVLQERPIENPRATFIHHRGEWTQPTEAVVPGVLSVLNPMPSDVPQNRLGFAKWLVSRENPLTARVVVNRAWAAFFGRGIVKTQEDFGFQGSPPSHPELLDWLAVRFMQDGWSSKKLHRLIVTSKTYQQSSRSNQRADAIDPENVWLWRGPRVRLDAEQVRDSALRAAGILSDKMYGPSVFPPQPPSVTTEGTYGAMNWATSSGADRYRRSLYTFTKRTAPFAFSNTFDAPSGEGCVVRRDRSNTPLQALTMLNDITIVEAAQALGRALAESQQSVEHRVREAYWRLFSRNPEPEELAAVLEFYRKQTERLESSGQSAKSLAGDGEQATMVPRAAWTAVVRALMNTDEFVTNR